jgi:catechol 2,3-dioxygenase-like lactoylglutathione lyase family enzyme
MIHILGLDHIVLRVVDLDAMLRFYCEALGCSVERHQEAIGLMQLRAGNALIDLVPISGKLGSAGGAPPGTEGRNLDHFCLRVEPFDVDAIQERLAAHGIVAGAAQSRYGADGQGPSVYITDPEGNVVELKGPPCALDDANHTDPAWEQRAATLWSSIDACTPEDFVARMQALVAELPRAHAVGAFEMGSAQDSTGRPELAVPLYRTALGAGLRGLRKRRATIQLASSLRNLGNAAEAVSLLEAELQAPSDALDSAVAAFLALALADLGREREALEHSLGALSRHLPRYNRSLARYAHDLTAKATS